ncbi:MAG: NAD-dependent dihydropyrimidine dehydrogenase subunit PreA [Acidobacteriia bacterium]|nr:NAD-dependent dihydropyrimidine dehydrogenase subunit PreA [Terriglobia bacterium]
MADLSITFAKKIKSPNPFWLASAPPTNSGFQVMRAFEAGWGGAVWKTIGEPIVNTTSRYSSIDYNGVRMMGFNNIELISDRPIEDNLREIYEVKKRFPHHAVIASLMVESKREVWHDIVKRTEDSGTDGLELNFGCPHGMSERGMGSAVGQVPEYCEMITAWVKEVAQTPVLIKLTPNVTNIAAIGRAAKRGGADGLSAINTINSITSIDLQDLTPRPKVRGKSAHGGYCGPAVKPIALNMVSQLTCDPEIQIPVSGIGGISTWQDAAEFMLLGCTSIQVCTAVMHYGFRLVEDMIDGLSNWMDEKGFKTIEDFRGLSLARMTDWGNLDMNYKIVASIDPDKCIGCDLCHIACWDTAHQCIHIEGEGREAPTRNEREAAMNFLQPPVHHPLTVHEPILHSRGITNQNIGISGNGGARRAAPPITPLHASTQDAPPALRSNRVPYVDEEECVGCNLCWLVCPVEGCITMKEVDTGLPEESWNKRLKRLSQTAE